MIGEFKVEIYQDGDGYRTFDAPIPHGNDLKGEVVETRVLQIGEATEVQQSIPDRPDVRYRLLVQNDLGVPRVYGIPST